MKRKPVKLRNLKPRTPDAAVIAQIRKLKPNLCRACPIRFFLYFSSQSDATKSANELRDKDFSVEVISSKGKLQWLCLASKEIVPEITTLATLRGGLVELALKYGGEYDGWEAEIADDSINTV
jgi:hypothetical protein